MLFFLPLLISSKLILCLYVELSLSATDKSLKLEGGGELPMAIWVSSSDVMLRVVRRIWQISVLNLDTSNLSEHYVTAGDSQQPYTTPSSQLQKDITSGNIITLGCLVQ